MKQWIALLFLCGQLQALPVGNPAEASLYTKGVFFDPCSVSPCSWLFMWVGGLDYRMGYWGDFTGYRQMYGEYYGQSANTSAKLRQTTNASYSVLNIYNWMDVFATFGVTRLNILYTTPERNARALAFFSPTFSWSVGTHATLYRNGPFYIGGEGQYLQTKPKLDHFYTYRTGVETFFNNTNPTIYEEWQVGFGVAAQIENVFKTSFVPYAAIKFSQGKFSLRTIQFTHDGVTHTLPDLLPADYFGWALGCSWLNQAAMGITAEVRFVDEKALSVYGEARF